jgi:ribosome-binding protein aMBF1 (putative translation factor)
MQPRKPQIVTFPVSNPQKNTANTKSRTNYNSGSNSNTNRDADEINKPKQVRPEVSDRIRRERTLLNWTQKDLAGKAGIQLNIVTEYESGSAINNQTEIQKILKALETGLREKAKQEKEEKEKLEKAKQEKAKLEKEAKQEKAK